MGIKFNCSNPQCRQRLEVEDALAGGVVPCPACGTVLAVPASHDIHFACANPDCGQHIVVDVSEAGRATKCPACGRVLRVPGDPARSLIERPAGVEAAGLVQIKDGDAVERKDGDAVERVPPGWKRLLWGWSIGATLLGVLLLGSHLYSRATLPAHLEEISDEIYLHGGTNSAHGGPLFSRAVAPVQRTATNQSGQGFQWYFVPPARLVAGRKYPALVDMTSSAKHDHARDIQFVANAGIFYVSPNSLGITKWGVVPAPQNVRAAYAELLKNPSVDAKRIYLCGQSITTVATCGVVDENPSLWRGVILFEAVRYPRLPADARNFPSVFVSIGLADKYNQGFIGPGNAEKFLRDACYHLIPARIDYQPGGHGYQPPQLQAAYKAAVKFILTDY